MINSHKIAENRESVLIAMIDTPNVIITNHSQGPIYIPSIA